MPDQVIITARIPGELKRKLEELKVNISALVRRSIEGEIRRLEMERLQRRAEDAAQLLERIPPGDIVKAIRSGRESR
jgi:post-segregation antitoxin (ccd killing protein)